MTRVRIANGAARLGPFGEAPRSEHRADRSYDDADASHLIHPNGSSIDSYDRPFLNAAARHLVNLLRGETA